jgi:hypothetical protein
VLVAGTSEGPGQETSCSVESAEAHFVSVNRYRLSTLAEFDLEAI